MCLADFIARRTRPNYIELDSVLMRERSIGLRRYGISCVFAERLGVPFERMQWQLPPTLQMFDNISSTQASEQKQKRLSSRKRCVPRRRFLLSKKRSSSRQLRRTLLLVLFVVTQVQVLSLLELMLLHRKLSLVLI